MNKQEIKSALIELLSNEDFNAVSAKIDRIANDFMLEFKEEQKKIERLQMDIDKEFEIDVNEKKLNDEIVELIGRYKAIRKEIKQQKTEQEQKNLKEKEALLKEFSELVNNEEHIGKAISAIQELRKKWNEIGSIPREKYQDIQTEYSRLNDLFSYNIQIFKELKEHDLKKNYSLKNQVIFELSQLADEKDIKKLEQSYRQLQNTWNDIGGTYQDKWEELKTKYWEQVRQINDRIKAHYEELKQKKENNYNKKLELVEKAKIIAENFEENHTNFEKATKVLLEIQEEWNNVGMVDKAKNDAVWKEFRAVFDTFFERKSNFYTQRKEEFGKHIDAKNKIIEQVEALKNNTEWDKTTKKILQLQEEWKKIGHTGQKAEQKLWNKLREACDHFFNAKKAFYDGQKSEEKTNLEAKQKLIEEINTFKPTENSKENLLSLKTFSDKFNEIGNVPFKDKNAIYKQFKDALDKQYATLNLSKDEKESTLFDIKMENASLEEIKSIISSERKRIYKQISEEEATLKQYENNLGFFNVSKSGEGLFKNVEQNIKNSKEKIASLKQRLEFLKNKEKELVAQG